MMGNKGFHPQAQSRPKMKFALTTIWESVIILNIKQKNTYPTKEL